MSIEKRVEGTVLAGVVVLLALLFIILWSKFLLWLISIF